MSKASKETQKLAKEMMDDSMPPDQRRLVPKIAWRRFVDLVRTRKQHHCRGWAGWARAR